MGYSARSGADFDRLADQLPTTFQVVSVPPGVCEAARELQRDLAHHPGTWHRTATPDLLIACTALRHGLGVVHVGRDYERIAEVRPLVVRRLG